MVRRPGKSQLVKAFSLEELRAALGIKLAQDAKVIANLRAKRDKLAAALEQVSGEIEAIEGAPVSKPFPPAEKRPGRRPKAKKAARKAAPMPAVQSVKRAAGRGRAKGKMSLAQVIEKVLSESKKRLAPKEIRAAIINQRLIPSISKSFVQQVANTLSRGDQFKRAKDGTYSV
jgi:hypothetical protein